MPKRSHKPSDLIQGFTKNGYRRLLKGLKEFEAEIDRTREAVAKPEQPKKQSTQCKTRKSTR